MRENTQLADRKLRILHVLRAPLGGLFRHVVDLAREQMARGHEVGLVVDSFTAEARAAEKLRALEPDLALGVLKLPMHRKPNAGDVAAIFRIEAHAKALGADVVHGHGSKGGLYARALAWTPKPPLRCYTPHGGSFNHVSSQLMQSIYMGVERLLAMRTDVLLFESVFIANRFRERIGRSPALVRIVQNGITEAEFVPVEPAPDAADFVYVGELRSAKGIDTLIDATALLTSRRGQTVRLILVGSGPDQSALQAQAEARGIASQVSFAGVLPARTAFTLGRTLVVPSRAESLPYVVLEAAAAQMPMVATDVGGISEIFGPYRNRLITCDDAMILAKAMEEALQEDAEVKRQRCEDLAAFVSTRFMVSIMSDGVLAGYFDGLARLQADPTARTSRKIVHQPS